MQRALTFAWRPGLTLEVAYARETRESGAIARFRHRWRWEVCPRAGELWVVVERHAILPWTDDRPPVAHRPASDLLRDWPLTLRIGLDGGWRGADGLAEARAGAGVDEDWFEAMPPAERRLARMAAADETLASGARDLWDGLVGAHLTVGPLAVEPQVIVQAPRPLPVVGTPVPWLLTVSANPLTDGTLELHWRNEPDPDAVAEALAACLPGRPVLTVAQEGRLQTDPATLVPRLLEITTHAALRLAPDLPTHPQVETRAWRFRELPTPLG